MADPARRWAPARDTHDPATGPIPLAAAHVADGLQRLGVIAAGQVPSVEGLRHSLAELGEARECFESAHRQHRYPHLECSTA